MRVPSQSGSACTICSSNSAFGTHFVTIARQSYSGPNQSWKGAPGPRSSADRFVHHASSPSGVLTASKTRSWSALMGRSLKMSATLRAPAPRADGLLAAGDREGAIHPEPERFRVLEQVLRHGVVLHDLSVGPHRAERAHSPRLEVRPVGLVDLEVDRIVVDEREEELAAVDPHAAEHGSASHAG